MQTNHEVILDPLDRPIWGVKAIAKASIRTSGSAGTLSGSVSFLSTVQATGCSRPCGRFSLASLCG
jgi:hypothetical protein